MSNDLKPLLEALLAKLDGMEARLKFVEDVAHKRVVFLQPIQLEPSIAPQYCDDDYTVVRE